MAKRSPQQRLIYVGDRESDFYDLLKRAQQLDYPADLLIRAQHNCVPGDDFKLWDSIDQQNELTRIVFTKPHKRGEKSRKVKNFVDVFNDRPQRVFVLVDGVEIETDLQDLQKDDIIVITAGQTLPRWHY